MSLKCIPWQGYYNPFSRTKGLNQSEASMWACQKPLYGHIFESLNV